MYYRIFETGEEINTIAASEEFVKYYCEKHGYTYELIEIPEPEPVEEQPSQLDIIEAQVTYTAMMTDTLLEV